MKKFAASLTTFCASVAINAAPVLASSEEGHAPNPLQDFGIIFAIAAVAAVLGFVAFKSARKKTEK